MASLINKIALVTGATRGIGKGIALQLSQNGAKVYITGRTLKAADSPSSGSLEETAKEIEKRGGKCIPVQVNHESDADIKNLFDQINKDQNGQLDILVNCAFKGGQMIFDSTDLRFWEMDPAKSWDDINNVGLRNNYICTVYAARMMTQKKQGLIVNITSLGGSQYSFNAAYGIGKAGVDRMSVDCGIELRKYNVACIGLLCNGVRTEFAEKMVRERGDKAVLKLDPNSKLLNELKLKDLLDSSETPEFSGKVIAALANDKNLMKYSSKVVIAADYASKNNIRDVDDRCIASHRQINAAMKIILPKEMHFLAKLVPNFVKVPQFMMDLVNSKF